MTSLCAPSRFSGSLLKTMAFPARRWSSVSLIQLAGKLSQFPAANPDTDKAKVLTPTKTISHEDFFPAISVNEEDANFSARLIIVPENSLKLSWDVLGFLIIVYQAVLVPYQIGFDLTSEGDIKNMEYFVQAFFVMDILLNFNTAYYWRGTLVVSRVMIAKQYLKVWFWLDVAATFPYEYCIRLIPGGDSIYSDRGSAAYKTPEMIRLLKMINFIRILRLLRLAKLKRVLYQLEDFISQDIIGSLFIFLRLSISAFFIAHWTACSWYMVSSIDSSEKPDTWVRTKGIWVEDGAERSEAYVTALYWAVTTMNTIGYGDISAVTDNEKVCAICAMVVSCGVFAYILGNISNVVNKQNELEAAHRKRVMSLNSYMKQKELSHDLRFRVRRYLDYIWEHQEKNKMEEDDILDMLSEPLRDEIYAHTRGPVFRSYGLFENFSSSFPQLLSKELSPEVFAPGDSVFDEGEKTNTLYFMLSGTLDIFHLATSSSFKLLIKGAYFGEIGFFAKRPRTASARCIEFVNLLSLSRDRIEHILTRMPDVKEILRVIEEKCRDDDYSVLKVSCYLCKTLGHVATKCNKIVLTRIKEDVKEKWLAMRKGNTVLINPKLSIPNYTRKGKTVDRDLRFGRENVVGLRKEYRDLYVGNSGLRGKIRKYLEGQPDGAKLPLTPSATPRGSVVDVQVRPQRPKRLTLILSDTPVHTESESSDSEDVSRMASFNMELMHHKKGDQSVDKFDLYRNKSFEPTATNVELFRRETYQPSPGDRS